MIFWLICCLSLLFVPSVSAAPIPAGVAPYGSVSSEVSHPPVIEGRSSSSTNVVLAKPSAEQGSIKDSTPQERADANAQAKILLFNTVEFKRPISSLAGWADLLKRNQAHPVFVAGKQFNKSTTWESFKQGAKGKKDLALLRYVHTFFNQWPYREDIVNWGMKDYWASPYEFLQKSGDCEDYAIIKYFTLKELGFPADKMRIVVLRDTIRNLAHAVLVAYIKDDAYVLDNLSSAVLSHKHFKHYTPQYSVNEFARWAHMKGRAVSPVASSGEK